MTEPAATPPAPEITKDARTWGMLCHLSALSGFVGVGFGFVLGPLIVWLIKKNEHEFADDQGKEALNFQITMAIAGIVLAITVVGLLLVPVVLVVDVVFTIIASIRASDGIRYRYPFALRLVK